MKLTTIETTQQYVTMVEDKHYGKYVDFNRGLDQKVISPRRFSPRREAANGLRPGAAIRIQRAAWNR